MPSIRDALPALFDSLADLSDADRAAALARLDASEPAVAAELRALFDAEKASGDFLGLLSSAPHRRPADAPVDQPLGAGSLIGPYRLVRPLGDGGMATVWLARDDRLDRAVAIKLLHDRGVTLHGRHPRARLFDEARLVARLDHPHIATIFDVGETAAGQPFIAMACYDGGTLAQRLANDRLGIADIIRIGRQLASALGAAHAGSVVHHDVKPANVLFDSRQGVRLADFGIARLSNPVASRSGSVMGTAAYLAPEQLRGEPADHRADLWAFGVTLYEMLAGRRPFDGASSTAIMYNILGRRPDAIEPHPDLAKHHAHGGNAFDGLVRLVSQLLEKDPARRLASAGDVEQTLIALEQSLGSAGSPEANVVRASVGARLSPLVGREAELATATALLRRTRLLTLTGPGGTGKTTLATELARLVSSNYANGVRIVTLATTTDATLVASAIADAVSVRESAALSTEEQLRRYFAPSTTLLLLDNFEHVLDAAPLVRDMLSAAPGLTVLVTSRAPLRIDGEQELPIPPLALPKTGATSAAAIAEFASVKLFVQRAQAARPDFLLTDDNAEDVAAICRRIDGLPLAIELAATRIKLLAPRALRARLEQRLDVLRSDARDIAPRHRTLRDVVEWSYDLLAPNEQMLLRRLSVFAGGFTLDAAAVACGEAAGDDRERATTSIDALDRVAALVDKSLVAQTDGADGEPRFHLLETIREYALDRLREAGEETEARATHRACFLALAERAAPELRGPSQVAWLQRLEREHDNLRAAFDDAQAADDLASGVRLAVALHWFWLGSRGFVRQTIERLQALDERIRAQPADLDTADIVPVGLHARLQTTLGLLTSVRGDHFRIPNQYYDSALADYQRAGDDVGVATVLNHLGWTSIMLGDFERAAELSTDALARHRAANNPLGVATASVNLGWVAMARGMPAEAEQFFESALAIHRERGDRRACAYATGHIATAAVRCGEHERALRLYDEVDALAAPLADRVLQPTFRIRREVARYELGADAEPVLETLETELLPQLRSAGYAWSIAFALAVIGRVYVESDTPEAARAPLVESLALRESIGDLLGVAESEARLAELARRTSDRAGAVAAWQASLTKRWQMRDAIGIVECLEGIASLAADDGDTSSAAHLCAGAAAIRERLGAPLPPRDRRASAVIDAEADGRAASTEALVSLAFTLLGDE